MQSYNQATVVPIIVPDLGLGETPVILSLWLVPQGSNVLEGDRVVELATNPATVDLLAPVAGQCVRQFVDEDTIVFPGWSLPKYFQGTGTNETGIHSKTIS